MGASLSTIQRLSRQSVGGGWMSERRACGCKLLYLESHLLERYGDQLTVTHGGAQGTWRSAISRFGKF